MVFLTVALVSFTATAALSSLWCRQSVCVVEKGFEKRRKMFVFVDIWVTVFFLKFPLFCGMLVGFCFKC